MTRINTNIPAIKAINRLDANQRDLNLRLERLATGLRINRGADDPAGLISSERLRAEIRGIEQAIENGARASNVISTAEGAMSEVSAMLLDLQGLVVEAANEAGLTDAEVAANQLQIDSILDSIDRIANTTTFASQRLLNGEKGYLLSGVPPSALPSVSVFAALLPSGGSREVVVQVTQSAQTAQIAFAGSNPGGTVTTSATTIELKGLLGAERLSFASGITLGQIRAAINTVAEMTGVSAVVSTPAAAGVGSALLLNSRSYGSEAFVSVEPLEGNFIVNTAPNTTVRDVGVDAGVLVDGQAAYVQGLRADIRARGLDLRLYLAETFAQTLSSATFSITGGGAVFQITPEISPNGQLSVGLNAVSTTKLGNTVVGRLYTLRSGEANALTSTNFQTAQSVVKEAIDQVSTYRGRLGNIQKNHIQTTVNSQGVALENLTASESVVRDADFAVELSALTRAQILVETTQSTLQIADSLPARVLSLLG
jgi:flagellin